LLSDKQLSEQASVNVESPVVSKKVNKRSFYKPLLPIYANRQWTPEFTQSYKWTLQKGFFEDNVANYEDFLKPMTRIELAQMIVSLAEII